MKISELLLVLSNLAEQNNISEPFIVGGMPRDKFIGVDPNSIKDIDITTGDQDSSKLAALLSGKWPDATFRLFDDSHISIDFKNIKVDFSNNYRIPGIDNILKEKNIMEPTELQKELFSRDFTINTLLQPMDLTKDVVDLTGSAIDDIKNKIIRTPIDPDYTIGYDARRILRAIKLSVRFGFIIDEELGETLIKYRGNLQNLSLAHIKKQINQMLKINSDKTLELLSKYKLLPVIPLSKMMQLEVVKKKMVQELVDE